MKEFSVGKTLDYAWALTKKHAFPMVGLLLLLCLVYYLAEFILGAIFSMSSFVTMLGTLKAGNPHEALASLISMFAGMIPAMIMYTVCMSVVYTVMHVGYYNTALRLVNGSASRVEFSSFKLPVLTFVKVFFASWLKSLLVGIATLFCILPGIFVAVRLMFVEVALIEDSELPFFDAYKKSWDITRSHFWSLLLLGIVVFILNIVGLCCCCVGILCTIVISLFAFMVAYVILSGTAFVFASDTSDNQTQEISEV